MSLFEVPGWSVPSAPVPQASKKRKRPSTKEPDDDVDEAERIHAAQKNIEKLMRSLGEGIGALENEGSTSTDKKKGDGKDKKGRQTDERVKGAERERGRKAERKAAKDGGQRNPSNQRKEASPAKTQEGPDVSPAKGKKKQKQKQKRKSVDAQSDKPTHEDVSTPSVTKTPTPQAVTSSGKRKGKDAQQGLTSLQANMKKTLDGARFRYV